MGIVIGIGTTCFGDIGRSGFAVGYLPATATASGLAKKPARLPYSSPNAKKHKQQLHTQTCWLQALFNLDETAQAKPPPYFRRIVALLNKSAARVDSNTVLARFLRNQNMP